MCNDGRLVLHGRAIYGGALQKFFGTQDSFLALPTALATLPRDPGPFVEWLWAVIVNQLQIMFWRQFSFIYACLDVCRYGEFEVQTPSHSWSHPFGAQRDMGMRFMTSSQE